MAVLQYTNENRGMYPFHADGNGEHEEDWVWWQKDRIADFGQGGIAKYLGANNNGAAQQDLYRCPSDDVSSHVQGTKLFGQPYLFSYSLNYYVAGNGFHNGKDAVNYATIHDPTHKMVMVEESEHSLDDGNWAPQYVGTNLKNKVSIRHDRAVKKDGVGFDDDRRGNVAFVDGHAEYLTRRDSRNPYYYDPKQ